MTELTNSDLQIQATKLADLVGALGSADHIQECVACIHRMGGTINLGTAVARSELLRVYRRRERGRLRKGSVVAGGDGLVESLAASRAEDVFVLDITDAGWSGFVFLENSPEKQCIGCITGNVDQDSPAPSPIREPIKPMVTLGDIVPCTISETGQWGAYALFDDRIKVFINFGELSWLRIRETSEVVSVGDVVDVAIMREPKDNHPIFLGSIKRAAPERNPYMDRIMKVGTILDANVALIGKDVIYLELPNRIMVGFPLTDTTNFAIGESKKIRLTKVLPDACIVEGDIVQPE